MIISELLRVAADNGMQGTVGGCGTGLGGSDVAPRGVTRRKGWRGRGIEIGDFGAQERSSEAEIHSHITDASTLPPELDQMQLLYEAAALGSTADAV
ncbi:hypothetical protein ACGFWD_34620 [Streptomyces sp. NPDC048448]|uniref:hypothetical protein n=1 Tax=unclassified Streptomyces TaxID=2593676 RepID=UPI0034350F67